jgi:hypothetical protein
VVVFEFVGDHVGVEVRQLEPSRPGAGVYDEQLAMSDLGS